MDSTDDQRWPTVKLGSLIEIHDSRRVPLSRIVREKRQGIYRYYGAQGVIDHLDDFIFDGEFLLVAEDGENLRSRKQPVAFFVSGKFWVNNHAHIITGRDGVADNRFLLHAINEASISGLISGAAQPKLTQANLREIELPAPKLGEQRRVAAILAAFDELIEINERRVELLEDLARSLFQEWFVRFRFPGHEDVDLVNSELGPIPKGWTPRSAAEIFAINPRIKATQSTYRKVTMGDVSQRLSVVSPSETAAKASGTKFLRDDVLLARITPCLENGKTALVKFLEPGEVGIGSTEFIVLRGTTVGPSFTYCAARSDRLREHAIKSMSGASGRQRVSTDAMKDLVLVEPPRSLAEQFEAAVGPMLDEVVALHESNLALSGTRELLVLRLVTGQLDISDIELGVLTPPEAA